MQRFMGTLSVLQFDHGGLLVVGTILGAALGGMLLASWLAFQVDLDALSGSRSNDAGTDLVGSAIDLLVLAHFVILPVLVLLSGHWIALRRTRRASTVVAVPCLLSFSLGTLLGCDLPGGPVHSGGSIAP
jgi:hypothetical protein